MRTRTGYSGIVLSMMMLAFSTGSFAQYQPNWASLDTRETPAWWKHAKFGIFIHWGLYSVPAYAPVREVEGVYEKYAEHYANRLITKNKLFTSFHEKNYGADFKYAEFAGMFKAQHFNPDQWSDLIQRSGAKYVVLTSKHHDGFTLWPSKESNGFNSVALGPKRDLVPWWLMTAGERRRGVNMGIVIRRSMTWCIMKKA